MTALATLYRFLHLLAHAGHNLVNGCTFSQDHEFLSELYGAYDSAFDSIVERMIGLGKIVTAEERLALDNAAAIRLGEVDTTDLSCNEDWFEVLLEGEKELCAAIEKLAGGKVSQGTLNLIAGLADESEARQYKLARRLLEDKEDDEATEKEGPGES